MNETCPLGYMRERLVFHSHKECELSAQLFLFVETVFSGIVLIGLWHVSLTFVIIWYVSKSESLKFQSAQLLLAMLTGTVQVAELATRDGTTGLFWCMEAIDIGIQGMLWKNIILNLIRSDLAMYVIGRHEIPNRRRFMVILNANIFLMIFAIFIPGVVAWFHPAMYDSLLPPMVTFWPILPPNLFMLYLGVRYSSRLVFRIRAMERSSFLAGQNGLTLFKDLEARIHLFQFVILTGTAFIATNLVIAISNRLTNHVTESNCVLFIFRSSMLMLQKLALSKFLLRKREIESFKSKVFPSKEDGTKTKTSTETLTK